MTDKILESARELADRLSADVQLAKTREEHIRNTARANEALILYNEMLNGQREATGQ